MRQIDLKIEIDIASRRLDYILIEGIMFNSSVFKFSNGLWVCSFESFPIGVDNDIDILIIVIGSPGTTSKMTVYTDTVSKGPFKTYKPFNNKGYAQFNKQITV